MQSSGLEGISNEPTELHRSNLIILNELGNGAFGVVYQGSLTQQRGPEVLVAVKSLRDTALDSERDELLEEALVMAQMSHENVVALIGKANCSKLQSNVALYSKRAQDDLRCLRAQV